MLDDFDSDPHKFQSLRASKAEKSDSNSVVAQKMFVQFEIFIF